jgi:transcriptional regulator with XRE-family HTH domain
MTTAEEVAAKKLIGRRLRHLLKRRSMTQAVLAARIGGRQGVVSDWLAGRRNMGYATGWRVAKALSVTYEEIVGPPTAAERPSYERDIANYGRYSDAP